MSTVVLAVQPWLAEFCPTACAVSKDIAYMETINLTSCI